MITKTDLHPEWRRIVELDRGHLAAAGINAEIFAVSSTLRWHAVLHGDADSTPSPASPSWSPTCASACSGRPTGWPGAAVVHDVLAVTEQIGGNLVAERTAQQDPAAVAALTRELTEAQAHATALKERFARWQQTLNDGIADLNADIDYDLRDRMKEISRLAEDELLGGGDPAKVWDQFAGWVQQEVAAAAAANFIWATQRVRVLATLVAEHFSDDRDHLLPALRSHPSDAIRSVRAMAAPAAEAQGLGTKALTGVRGGYMGMLMFGMLGTLSASPR